MSHHVSPVALVQAAKDLALEWEQTKADWHDAKSQEFERKFLEELPHHIARSAEVIEEIDAVLRKVRTDCE